MSGAGVESRSARTDRVAFVSCLTRPGMQTSYHHPWALGQQAGHAEVRCTWAPWVQQDLVGRVGSPQTNALIWPHMAPPTSCGRSDVGLMETARAALGCQVAGVRVGQLPCTGRSPGRRGRRRGDAVRVPKAGPLLLCSFKGAACRPMSVTL